MPKLRSNHVGRLRILAAKILNANLPDWRVDPGDIKPATGAWRTNATLDVFRWQVSPKHKMGFTMPIYGCWETLTEFVKLSSKYGCSVSEKHHTIHTGEPPLNTAS